MDCVSKRFSGKPLYYPNTNQFLGRLWSIESPCFRVEPRATRDCQGICILDTQNISLSEYKSQKMCLKISRSGSLAQKWPKIGIFRKIGEIGKFCKNSNYYFQSVSTKKMSFFEMNEKYFAGKYRFWKKLEHFQSIRVWPWIKGPKVDDDMGDHMKVPKFE